MSGRIKGRVGLAILSSLILASVAYQATAGRGLASPGCSGAPGAPPCARAHGGPEADPRAGWERMSAACLCDVKLPGHTVWRRAMVGLWRSMSVGLFTGLGVSLVALLVALLARWLGGVLDVAVARCADLFFSVPDVLVLMTIGFAVKVVQEAAPHSWIAGFADRPLFVVSGSLVAIGWAAPARQIRDRLRSLEGQDFVAAAESLGASRGRILVKHLLPFAWDYVLALFLLRVPASILAESTVSFLGFGFPQTDEASLGSYLSHIYQPAVLLERWDLIGPPMFLLLLLVAGFQLTGLSILARHQARSSSHG